MTDTVKELLREADDDNDNVKIVYVNGGHGTFDLSDGETSLLVNDDALIVHRVKDDGRTGKLVIPWPSILTVGIGDKVW